MMCLNLYMTLKPTSHKKLKRSALFWVSSIKLEEKKTLGWWYTDSYLFPLHVLLQCPAAALQGFKARSLPCSELCWQTSPITPNPSTMKLNKGLCQSK